MKMTDHSLQNIVESIENIDKDFLDKND